MTAHDGLQKRYEVRKVNDPAGEHNDCRYFVLDPQHDEWARAALQVYADLASIGGLHTLAAELEAWIAGVRQ